MLTVALLATALATTPSIHADYLDWHSQRAAITANADGSYVLNGPAGERRIPASTATAQTASTRWPR